MKTPRVAFCSAGVVILMMGAIVILAGLGAAQPAVGPAEGVEVLARGPVHEAFAEPVAPKELAPVTVPKQPPDPIDELPPGQKPEGADVEWIPGYWAWDEDSNDYLWVSGVWREPPPAHHWVPGYWHAADGGWQWVSGYWADSELTQVELLPPPPEPVAEAIPQPPDATSTYMPGVWVYRQDRYWWRPGFWVAYRPGWVWAMAGYHWTPGGYVFVEGHWDQVLERRGLCFAPVRFERRFFAAPRPVYRPFYALATDFLFGALFVNPRHHHYYFGDYYDAAYARRGYQPWIDYRPVAHVSDPLYSYYRWEHRADPRWETNLRNVYVARQAGTAPRPPRTLALAQKQGGDVQPVIALNQFKDTRIKLQAVPPAQAETFRKQVEHIQNVRQQRTVVEPKALTRPPVIETPKDKPAVKPPTDKPPTDKPPIVIKPPQDKPPVVVKPPERLPPDKLTKPLEHRAPVKIELPRPPEIRKPAADHAPPPRPNHPQVVPQPKLLPKEKDKGKDKKDKG